LMRLPRLLPALLALSLLAPARPARAAWNALEEIPVESPVYRLIEDVASCYPLPAGLLLTRPWTRAELGRFLDHLTRDVPAASRDAAVLRLRRELEPQGGFEGLEPLISTDTDDASLEISPYGQLGYAEDRSRERVVRDDRFGVQASLAFSDHGLMFVDGYVGTVSPGSHGTPDAAGNFGATSSDLTAWFDRAYVTWDTKSFAVRAGHTWLRWGPGMQGTLALSEAAPAFDLIEPRVRFGGAAQYAWFVASLDPAAETYLAGHRLELRAGPSVEMSVSELARFNGAANAPLYLVPVIPFALMERRVRGSGSAGAD